MSLKQKFQAVKKGLKEVWDQVSLPDENGKDNDAVEWTPPTYHDGDVLITGKKEQTKQQGQQ